MKKTKRAQKERQEKGGKLSISCLVGGAVGLGITLLSVLLSPIALLKSGDPTSMVTLTAAICLFAGGLIGGGYSASRCKENPMGAGLLSSAVMGAPLLLLSLLLKGEMSFAVVGLMLACLLASAVTGTLIVTYRTKDKRKKMKKVLKGKY